MAHRHRAIGPLIGAAVLTIGATAHGQQRLRHEFVPEDFFSAHPIASRGDGLIDGGGALPEAVRREGVDLQAPDPESPPGPAFGEGPDDVTRKGSIRPDRKTTVDEPLTYHAMFNPSVAPFRRDSVFDVVRRDYEMIISKTRLSPAPKGPRQATAGREMFWGDITVQVADRSPHPIPSVSPDMRILAIEGPEVKVLVDEAANYYITTNARGTVRLRMLVDAGSIYFSGGLPGNVPLDVSDGHPMTALPPEIRARGRAVLSTLNVRPEGSFSRELDKLVRHFRAFKASDTLPNSGDIYTDLALGGVGVCRHRTFAFTITARAAGVPTRFVANEAHAFAEVLTPDGFWRRVDLGGVAPELNLEQGEGRRLHQPPADPFSKPESYLKSYSNRMASGDVPQSGQPDQPPAGGATLAGTPPPLKPGAAGPPSPGQTGTSGDPGASGPQSGAGGLSEPSGPGTGTPGDVEPGGTTPAAPSAPVVPYPSRVAADGPGQPVRVTLTVDADHDGVVYRGEPLPFTFKGRITDVAGMPGPKVPVQIYLKPESGPPLPVGPPLTPDPEGRFQLQGQLPADLSLGRYTVEAVTRADGEWASGISQ
ncbi:MAG: transglutaminase domain-containing protein [Bradymonadia bacterium]